MSGGYSSLYGGAGIASSSGGGGPVITQTIRDLLIHQDLRYVEAGNTATGEAVNFGASGYTFSYTQNGYANGVRDNAGGVIQVPAQLELTTPITMVWYWAPVNDSAGDVEWTLRYNRHRLGETLNGTAAVSTVSSIVPLAGGAGQADTTLELTFSIDLTTLSIAAGDLFTFLLERDASGGNPDDTYQFETYVVSLRAFGLFNL